MTLDEIRASDKPFLGPVDVAGVLGCDAQSIRLQAREFPEALGFPVICRKDRPHSGTCTAWTAAL